MTDSTPSLPATSSATSSSSRQTPSAQDDVDAADLPTFERWRRALEALRTVMADPDRTDQVLVFSTYANAGTMHRRLHRFYDDPRGRRLYDERRTIDSKTVDLDELLALPTDTLGHAYATFLRSRGLTPEIFDGAPERVSDPKAAYVIQRMRQTHDLWHVVTGHETDPFGEIALQAFTFGQIGAPSTLVLSAAGTLNFRRLRPGLARAVLAAFKAGRAANRFVIFPWEDHWATPLADVQRLLNVTPLPGSFAAPAVRIAA
jgi:ubiquinone biosynthesis protein COQ4